MASASAATRPTASSADAEWRLRCVLAALCRPAARFGMDDITDAHSTAGMAVSAQARRLLPITENAMMFFEKIGFHDYESFATQEDERASIAADLGADDVLILRDHRVRIGGAALDTWAVEIERVVATRMVHHDLVWNACLGLLSAEGGDCRR